MAGLCRYATVCPVFKGEIADMPVLARQYRARYCVTDCHECARYAVAEESGPSAVPETLLPNQHERGYQLVSSRWSRRGANPAAAVLGPG